MECSPVQELMTIMWCYFACFAFSCTEKRKQNGNTNKGERMWCLPCLFELLRHHDRFRASKHYVDLAAYDILNSILAMQDSS